MADHALECLRILVEEIPLRIGERGQPDQRLGGALGPRQGVGKIAWRGNVGRQPGNLQEVFFGEEWLLVDQP